MYIAKTTPIFTLGSGDFPVFTNLFKPNEAAAMTNLSTSLQRVWRRRKIFPWAGEAAGASGMTNEFGVQEIAWMALAVRIAELGFSLETAASEAERYEEALVRRLLYAGAPSYAIRGDTAIIDAFMTAFDEVAERAQISDLIISYDKDSFEATHVSDITGTNFEFAAIISLERIANEIKSNTDRALFKVVPSDEGIERCGLGR